MKIRLVLTVSHIVPWKLLKRNIYTLLPLTWWEERPPQTPSASFPLQELYLRNPSSLTLTFWSLRPRGGVFTPGPGGNYGSCELPFPLVKPATPRASGL